MGVLAGEEGVRKVRVLSQPTPEGPEVAVAAPSSELLLGARRRRPCVLTLSLLRVRALCSELKAVQARPGRALRWSPVGPCVQERVGA